MRIPGIKEINFEQASLNKSIPRSGSHEKYIAKDFVLDLGGIKIKLKARDSLMDVVRKINLQSHVTGIRAEAVKGKLTLELIRNKIGSGSMIRLSKNSSGGGMPLNANQIIANYLASLPPKISTGIQVWDEAEHNLYLLNELPQGLLDEENNLGQFQTEIWPMQPTSEEDGPEQSFNTANDELNIGVEGEVEVLTSFYNNSFSQNMLLGQVPTLSYSNVNSYNNSLNNSFAQNFLSESMIEKLNLLINQPLDVNNCEFFYKTLVNKDRKALVTALDKKILKFEENPNNVAVAVPVKPQDQDRFYFCIKQMKTGKMTRFQ